jgi:hypothetical protein
LRKGIDSGMMEFFAAKLKPHFLVRVDRFLHNSDSFHDYHRW